MSTSSAPSWPEPGNSADVLLSHGIPAEVTAHLIAFSVQAIASWKAAGRHLEDLDSSSMEATWLRLGVPLEDIRVWEDAGVDPESRGLAAFIADQGTPHDAKRLEKIWQSAVTAGHATGEVEPFLLGFMMLFVDATAATRKRFLDGRELAVETRLNQCSAVGRPSRPLTAEACCCQTGNDDRWK